MDQFLGDLGLQATVESINGLYLSLQCARTPLRSGACLLGQPRIDVESVFEMSLFPNKMTNTNTGEWDNPESQAGLAALANVRYQEQEQGIIHHMLEVFRDDAP